MRFQRTTGLSPYQLGLLIAGAERSLPGWERPTGRPRALPLWKVGVVLCFLLRHNAVQEMAGELFGISHRPSPAMPPCCGP